MRTSFLRCATGLLVLLGTLALTSAAGANHIYNSRTLVFSGANEVPPNASTATGTAKVIVDTDANTLSYDITYSGFSTSETAAHIHGFAGPGVNAGVLTPIPAGLHKVGVWTFTDVQEPSILAGLTYFNIHSTAFGGGEIRTQIIVASTAPGISTWGMIALALLLVASAAFVILRRRSRAV